ncbi:MAG: hypothetical protein V4759_04540 [Pseudomonadota bacterium]
MFRKLFGPREAQAALLRSVEEQKRKQQANALAWGLGSTDRWDVDLDLGTIQFSNAAGRVATSQVQIIGTYDSNEGIWLWGWANPSVSPPQAHAARLVRDFGEKYGLSDLTERMIHCSQEEAWQFTAIGLHLSGGAGSYRGPAGSTFVFMTFGEITIQRVH